MAFKPQNNEGTVEYANSLVTVAEFDDFFADRGKTYAQPTEEKEVALIKATDYVNNNYNFVGEQLYSNQGTSFPRIDVYNNKGEAVEGIPIEVKYDTFYVAGWLLDNPTLELYIDVDPTQVELKREKKKVGDLEKDLTYFEGDKDDIRTISTARFIESAGYLTYDEGRLYI